MELRQLQYFVAVVEEANFTRAAARLHLAQPGVSAQIRQLERELGQPLLDRSGGRVTPTEAGEAVLPYARAALAAAEGVRQTVDEFTGLLRGRVALGMVSGAAADGFDVASLLADFHDTHPGVEMALTEDNSERMLAALRGGELDIALIGLADEPPPGISAQIVLDVPLVAAVAADDPLVAPPGRTELPPAALRDRPLISLPRGTGLRAVLERLCAAAGFRPRIAFEAASPHLLAQLAARGLGVAVVPDLPADAARAYGLRTLPLTGRPRPRGRIALVWRTEGPAGPAARALLDRLRTALPERAGRHGHETRQ
ncbi:LysR family transcriptional regulator [Streptomyces chattanoogensis]|uniref:LysR family transcriptional regulator n=1 Tax=Streptomyces chattanoogensis TaxID=66876 RepID=A0A0N0XVM0_9ACTN|nr:LysR family transcriptional regulator [Streptomyces chattanoogensis]KPC63364.1 LysR family transcriptional regulator [Streptomyces chattanoogensis]